MDSTSGVNVCSTSCTRWSYFLLFSCSYLRYTDERGPYRFDWALRLNTLTPMNAFSNLHPQNPYIATALSSVVAERWGDNVSGVWLSPHGSNVSLHYVTQHQIAKPILPVTLNIWPATGNPAYGICGQFVQCASLVLEVKKCQSPDYVISMSNNPSSVTVVFGG